MARNLYQNCYVIQGCNPRDNFGDRPLEELPSWYEPGREVHSSQNAYLFVDDENLLFDTLSRLNTDKILSELDEILGDQGLDYLVLSHPETPHAGNTMPILEQYPNCTVVTANERSVHELYYLEDALKVDPGDEIALGQYTVQFEHPTFLDHSMHLWMSERQTGTLFTVDWLGTPHLDTECEAFADEIALETPEERLLAFHERAFGWLECANLEKIDAEIEQLLQVHQPSTVAPAHGFVVRENVPEYTRQMKSVARTIRDQAAWVQG